jgi:hypothetical protein
MDIEWNKPNIIKASIAGVLLLIAIVVVARVFLGGSNVEMNEEALQQHNEAAAQGGSRMTSPEED